MLLGGNADQPAGLGVLDGVAADQAGECVQVQGLAEGEQPQQVQHIVGELIDTAVEQRGQLGGDRGASAQLPHPAHLAQRSGFQRSLDQVSHKQCVAAGGLPHQIGTEPLDAAAERLLDQADTFVLGERASDAAVAGSRLSTAR